MIMQWLKASSGHLSVKPSIYKRLNLYLILIRTIDEYIYWYNHDRIKITLGGYSPIQYRLMNQQMIQ